MTDNRALLKKIDVTDFAKIDEVKTGQILSMAQQAKLTKSELARILKLAPQAIDFTSRILSSADRVSNHSAESQKIHAENVGKAINAFKEMSLKSDNSKFHESCAEYIREALRESQKMNENDNHFWTKFMAGILVVGGIGFGFLTGRKSS